MKEEIVVYSYTPTMIFPDFWEVVIYKHEIFYIPFLFFFKRRVRRTTTLFSCFQENKGTNHAQVWLDKNPQIKLEGLKEEFVRLKVIK